MKRVLMILAGLLLVAPLVFGSVDKSVSWNAPTERVNGDALAAGEIAGYDLECQTTGGQVVYSTGLPATPESHQTPEIFESGEYICRMRTRDVGGLESEWGESNVFIVGRCDVSDCRPMPPSSITVNLP